MRYFSRLSFVVPLFLGCEASRLDNRKLSPDIPPPFPILAREDASSGIFPTYGSGTATGTGTVGFAPTSTSKPMPTNSPSLACHGTDNKYWLPLDDATQAINEYCEQPDLNIHDPNSGSRQRLYYGGTSTEISIAIDWPPGSDIELNTDDCNKQMTKILNDCDGNNPLNPLNWKHGGNLTVGSIVYHVDPITSRYSTGHCSVNVIETSFSTTTDWPERFQVDVAAYDGEKSAKRLSRDVRTYIDFGANYTLSDAYYSALSITPAFVGTNFKKQNKNVQFRIGDQVWSMKDTQRFGFSGPTQPPNSNFTGFWLKFDC